MTDLPLRMGLVGAVNACCASRCESAQPPTPSEPTRKKARRVERYRGSKNESMSAMTSVRERCGRQRLSMMLSHQCVSMQLNCRPLAGQLRHSVFPGSSFSEQTVPMCSVRLQDLAIRLGAVAAIRREENRAPGPCHDHHHCGLSRSSTAGDSVFRSPFSLASPIRTSRILGFVDSSVPFREGIMDSGFSPLSAPGRVCVCDGCSG